MFYHRITFRIFWKKIDEVSNDRKNGHIFTALLLQKNNYLIHVDFENNVVIDTKIAYIIGIFF